MTENQFEDGVWIMVDILFRPQCVKKLPESPFTSEDLSQKYWPLIFLYSEPEPGAEQTVESPVIRDAMTLMLRCCNDTNDVWISYTKGVLTLCAEYSQLWWSGIKINFMFI